MGISPKLYRQLRAVLLDCGTFASANELNTIFVEKRLSPWRNRLPEANTLTGRVEGLINFLYYQYNDGGKNALVLLLYVLSERLDPGDACHHYLAKLAHELERELKRLDTDRFEKTELPIQTFPQDIDMPNRISKEGDTSKLDLTRFRALMIKHFNESELHNLCFDLGIDMEILPGRGKVDKTRELITYCQRHHRLGELVKKCSEERPSVTWGGC